MSTKLLTIPELSPYNPNYDCDIGVVSNYNSGNNTFEAGEATVSEIRNVLEESSNSVRSLCRSDNVNEWALFKPSGNAPYKMGDFLGYNHSANPSTYYPLKVTTQSRTIYYSSGYKCNLVIHLGKGEIVPASPRSWDYLKIEAVATGEITGTYTSIVSIPEEVSSIILTIAIDIPDNQEYNFNLTVNTSYVTSENSVIGTIEDSHPDINFTATIYYYNAPVLLTDNTQSYDEVRHYYGVTDANLYRFIMLPESTVRTKSLSGNFIDSGLVDNLPDSIKEQGGSPIMLLPYRFSVIKTGTSYRKVDLLNTKVFGAKYLRDYDHHWYEVKDSIPSGYHYFYDSNAEVLTGFPTTQN